MITAIVALSGAVLLLLAALIFCIFIIVDQNKDLKEIEEELEPVGIVMVDE